MTRSVRALVAVLLAGLLGLAGAVLAGPASADPYPYVPHCSECQ